MMNKPWIVIFIAVLMLCIGVTARAQQNQTGKKVDVRSGINHEEYPPVRRSGVIG
jgi:hypothetical protein